MSSLPHQTQAATLYVTPVKIYYCLTRRAPSGSSTRCDYNGNAGTQFANGTPTSGAADAGSGAVDGVVVRTNVPQISLQMITDGTSNTVMVAEKWLHPKRHNADGGDNEASVNAGWDECVVRIGGGTYTYDYNPSGGPAVQGSSPRTIPRTPRHDSEAPQVVDSGGATVTIWNQQFGRRTPAE